MFTAYKYCIELCNECALMCERCASACLGEADVAMMVHCIQLNQECSAICTASGKLMVLESNHANTVCQICADICTACAAECEKHDNEHCRKCATICRE